MIDSLFAPIHWPLLSATFACFSCILPCASIASGVGRPRSGDVVRVNPLLLLYDNIPDIPVRAVRVEEYGGIKYTRVLSLKYLFTHPFISLLSTLNMTTLCDPLRCVWRSAPGSRAAA